MSTDKGVDRVSLSLVVGDDRVVAVGVDTASVADAVTSLERFGTRYVQRVCSPAEAGSLPEDPTARAGTLARLWAAKEAATKTLAPASDDSWPWPAVEVDLSSGEVRLHGRARELAAEAGIERVRVLPVRDAGAAVPSVVTGPRATVVALALAGLGSDRRTHPPSPRRTS